MTSFLALPFTMPVRMVETGLHAINAAFRTSPAKSPGSSLVSTIPDLWSITQAGLQTTDALLRTIQSAARSLTGQKQPEPPKDPLVDGPRNIDMAISDFADRLSRIARLTVWDSSEWGTVFQETLTAARYSFGYLDLRDPRNFFFPLHFVLSLGTLVTELGLRAVATAELVNTQDLPQFFADFFKIFTDTQLYTGLEYWEQVEKYQARLARVPDDDALRVELGHTQIKLGLYDEATANLLRAANNSSVRGAALQEAAVAFHRRGKLEDAARAGSGSLYANPGNERVRAWLWLTAHKMGGYPEFIPPSQRMEMKAGFAKPTVEFEDIAAKIGLDKTSGGRGIAVFDYNNDGLLDVVITCAFGGCTLYRNNGDGTFTDVSVESGLDTAINAFVVIAGDYNNDGYVDLFITRNGFFPGQSQLFRNNGDGTFTDITAEAGLKMWSPAFGASWVDYDCNGNLDLFVANNISTLFDRKAPNHLFHNNGDGTFTDVAKAAGLNTLWPTIGSAWGDYNDDGYPDLFLSNGVGKSQLYRNNGDGTFTDVSAQAGIHETCFGAVSTWFDYNNDGRLDLMQGIWSNHEDVVYTMRHGKGPPNGTPTRIYHNNGDGTFTKRDREIGLTGCFGTMSANVGDLNNDGYLDLVLGNGSPKMDRLEPPTVLENDGTRFHNVTFAAGFPFSGKGHGTTMADLFGDGRLSVLLGAGGGYPGDMLTTRIFYPKRLPGNYLNVRLTGVKSNRSAFGARIRLHAAGRQQYREISCGTSFGCLPLEQHFGLASAEKVDALQIRWPSGLLQEFAGLPANRTLLFTEGHAAWQKVYQR